MTDLNLRLRIEAEVAAARREIAAVKEDMNSLGRVARDASGVSFQELVTEFAGVDGAIVAVRNEAEDLARATRDTSVVTLQGLVTEFGGLDNSVVAATGAVMELGQAAHIAGGVGMQGLSGELARVDSGATVAQGALTELGQAARASGNASFQELVTGLTGVDRTASSARDSAMALYAGLGQLASSYDALRMSVDQDLAATIRFAQAQDLARLAVLNGIATQQEATATLDLLGQKLQMVGFSNARDSATALFAGLDQLASGFDALRMSVDENYAATARFADAQDMAWLAVLNGIATEREAAATLDLLAQKLGLVGFNSARDSATALFAGLDQLSSGFDALRMSVDENYAATARFADAQDMARLAVLNGITTEQEAAATLDLLAQKLGLVEAKAGATGAAMQRHTMSSGAAAAASQNLAFQFNDVAMMAAAGQNPLMLAMQQGTQIAQVMGQAGAAGALGLLKQGFMAFLNPTTLVTVALVAGGAALLQWAFDAGGAANAADVAAKANETYAATFGKLRGQFSAATSLHTEYVQAVLTGNKDLMQAIMLEAQARQAQFNLDRIAQAEAKKAADEAVAAQRAKVDATVADGKAIADQIAATKKAMADQQASDSVGLGGTDFSGDLETQQLLLNETTQTLIRQRGELNKTSAEYAVINAQVAVLEAQIKANGDLVEIVKDGVVGTKDALDDAGVSGKVLHDALKRAWDASIGLEKSGPDGSWLSGAIGQADTLVGKVWDAITAARILAMQSPYTLPDADGRIVDRDAQNANMFGRGHPSSSTDVLPASATPGGVRPKSRPTDIDFGVDAPATSGGSGGGSSASGSLTDITAEAKAAMDTLDQAIAAINEKVQAGLITTAEAANAVTSAKGQAADTLADLIAQLGKLGPAGKDAAELIRTNLAGLATDLKSTGADLAKTLSEGFKSPFKDFLTGAKSAEDAMDALGDFVIDKFAEMAAEKATTGFIEPLFNSLFAGVGTLFGGGGSGGAVATSPIPPPRPFAQGGVPDGAPLSVLRNQVLDRPTLFPMARGMGLMAEAGREAIVPVGDGGVLAMMAGREIRLPLLRGAGGRLGVEVPATAGAAEDGPPRPFAQGGVPDGAPLSVLRTQVLDRPTLFPMARGMGLMAEAGREAIMPVGDGGVLAIMAGREIRLPLLRGAGGRLGVEVPATAGAAEDGPPRPFAQGGVPDGAPVSELRNQVLDRPTLFPMARGMGLMAEAGREAIMPVGDGGVLAMMGGREIRLPLMRGTGGRLGVDLPEWTGSMIDRAPLAFASGGLIQNGQSLPVGAYGGGGGGGGAVAGDVPKVTVYVTTPAGETAQVSDRMEGNNRIVDIIVEQVEGAMAGNLRAGRGAHAAALTDTFGLRRTPR